MLLVMGVEPARVAVAVTGGHGRPGGQPLLLLVMMADHAVVTV